MPAPGLLLVSESVWLATVEQLDRYADAAVEAGLYWYGLRAADAAFASVAGIPTQQNQPRNFEVDSHDLAVLTRRVAEPAVVVAQLHTHPGSDTNHSGWDNTRAVSRKVLSLVFPSYGRNAKLAEAGVHEFVQGRWLRLGEEALERIVLVPTVIDTRR